MNPKVKIKKIQNISNFLIKIFLTLFKLDKLLKRYK